MRLIFSLLAFLAISFGATAANAHESRRLYVEIWEKAPNTFVVTWKIPASAKVFGCP